MSVPREPSGLRARLLHGAWPAALTLVLGLLVLCLRPPLPIDETRYLEVFRESLEGSPLLLTLSGEPYAEKTPLLFWLARLLTWTGLPAELALRAVPVLASALVVLLAARLGRRLGLGLVGWLQAALCLPALTGQLLLFDALLALCVWGAVDCWIRRRDVGFGLASAAALLAKGPVAYLFLVPFVWSTSPLRATRPGDGRRAALVLGLALLPLAAWALAAASLGGAEFASALLWERWAGRVAQVSEHVRPVYFYAPVVLLGALPASFLLLGRLARGSSRPPVWCVRLGIALLLELVLFTLLRGKQAHYLVPAAPALACVLAWRLETAARGPDELRHGVHLQLALLAAVAVAGLLGLEHLTDSVSSRGRALIASGAFRIPLALALLAALAGWLGVRRAGRSPHALLVVSLASFGGGLLPLHWLAGELLFPRALAGALGASREAIAFLGPSQHGLYALLARRSDLVHLEDARAIPAWFERCPDGLLVATTEALGAEPPRGLVTEASDTVHRKPVLVLRAGNGRPPRSASSRSSRQSSMSSAASSAREPGDEALAAAARSPAIPCR